MPPETYPSLSAPSSLRSIRASKMGSGGMLSILRAIRYFFIYFGIILSFQPGIKNSIQGHSKGLPYIPPSTSIAALILSRTRFSHTFRCLHQLTPSFHINTLLAFRSWLSRYTETIDVTIEYTQYNTEATDLFLTQGVSCQQRTLQSHLSMISTTSSGMTTA